MNPRAAALVLLFLAASSARAATFTVSSSGDSGPGTLRQAILDANANPGADQIVFTVGVVNATATLPQITSPVTIDGTFGSDRVTVNGVLFDCSRAFHFATGSSGSTLTRVIVDDVCESLRIGADVTSVTVSGSVLGASTILGDDNLIGGTTESARNVFRGLLTIDGGDRNRLFRNSARLLRVLFANDNRIGRSGVVGSVSDGNGIGQLVMQSAGGTIVEGNLFPGLVVAGPAIDISNALPPASGATITRNTIRNYPTGIRIRSGAAGVDAFTGASLISNHIFEVDLAIDLGGDGPTPNDPAPDADAGANHLQNFPVLTSAVLSRGQLTVQGTLASAPLTTYLVEVYTNDPFSVQATIPVLPPFQVTTDATGTVSFTRTGTPADGNPDFILTALATNRATGDTSELSAPLAIVNAEVEPIPTLSEWSLIALALGLGLLAAAALRG